MTTHAHTTHHNTLLSICKQTTPGNCFAFIIYNLCLKRTVFKQTSLTISLYISPQNSLTTNFTLYRDDDCPVTISFITRLPSPHQQHHSNLSSSQESNTAAHPSHHPSSPSDKQHSPYPKFPNWAWHHSIHTHISKW